MCVCVCPQREELILELEEERRLRLGSEKHLQEVTQVCVLGRAQMVSLQPFSRWVQSSANTAPLAGCASCASCCLNQRSHVNPGARYFLFDEVSLTELQRR